MSTSPSSPSPLATSGASPSRSKAPSIRSLDQLNVGQRRVFLRLDLNAPLEGEPGNLRVADDNRIREALPTVRALIERGARVIIASHLGRPDGKHRPEYSLEPVVRCLAEHLGQDVTLADDCVGEGIELMTQSLKGGQVLCLENLRFHAGEEANDPAFVHLLGKLTDVYVNDAFGTCHRKHASTYGLAAMTAERGMGGLIEREVVALDKLLHGAARPFVAVLGGSKVSDKIKTIDALLKRVQGLVVGGAMAHAFWAVQGDQIPAGAKQPKPDDVEAARQVFKQARAREIPIYTPADTVAGFDIGPQSVARFRQALAPAQTIFWNGPLGWFEKPEYARGTFAIAEYIATLSAYKVVGGGDTVAAIQQSGFASGFDHLSTGGGAVLEYLEQESLPGIEVLKLPPSARAL